MLKVSKKSPSSSSAGVSGCAGTEELQQGACVAQHTASAQLCPLFCKHKGPGHDTGASEVVFNFSVYQLEKLSEKSFTVVLKC